MKKLQDSINQIISEREKIWQNYDRAFETQKDLIDRFSRNFSDSNNSSLLKSVEPLTSNKLPPDEVVASIEQLQILKNQINQERENISQCNQLITELENKSKNIVTTLTIVAVVIIVAVVFMIKNSFEEDNSYKSNIHLYSLITYTSLAN